jgi:hypothetical protein
LKTLVGPESEHTALDIALDIEGYADKPFIAGILIDAGAKFSAEEFDTLYGEFKNMDESRELWEDVSSETRICRISPLSLIRAVIRKNGKCLMPGEWG